MLSTLQKINHLIHQDSKTTTYKFALLRATIEVIEEESPYVHPMDDRVHIPLGAVMEKWVLYYYPLFEMGLDTSQINGGGRLAFHEEMREIVHHYQTLGGISVLQSDLEQGIPIHLQPSIMALMDKVHQTIVRMPMKYLGTSLTGHEYGIYQLESRKEKKRTAKSTSALIKEYGFFSIPSDYHQAFKVMGGLLMGTSSIMSQWAEFTARFSRDGATIEKSLQGILTQPVKARYALMAKSAYDKLLQSKGELNCVWTGRIITQYELDHLLPFSLWRSNHLWNLAPTHPKVNNSKRDGIPTASIIEARSSEIISNWTYLRSNYGAAFDNEMGLSLVAAPFADDWQDCAIAKLISLSDHLIHTRGHTPWEP
jgi:hypothetical protein